MKPLIVLISSFLLVLLYTYTFNQGADIDLAGRVSLAVTLLFTASAHFVFLKGMMMMVPPFIPAEYKKAVVYVSGMLEIAAAIGIMFEVTRMITGYLLVLFFIILLPANIYSVRERINIEKADYSGPGISYLWFRMPLQMFFIVWTAWFTIIHYY